MPRQRSFKPGIYKHFKGDLYRTLFLAKHSETEKDMVVYIGLSKKGEGQVWVRPKDMFLDYKILKNGKKVKRFEFVKDIS